MKSESFDTESESDKEEEDTESEKDGVGVQKVRGSRFGTMNLNDKHPYFEIIVKKSHETFMVPAYHTYISSCVMHIKLSTCFLIVYW